MPVEVADVLHDAVEDVRADPALAGRVMRRVRRRRLHRRVGAAGAASLLAAVTVGVVATHHGQPDTATLVPAVSPPPLAPSARPPGPDLLAGPVGPRGVHGPTRMYGRAYPIGTTSLANGQPATEIVFLGAPTTRAFGPGPDLYTAKWVPGTPLRDAWADGEIGPARAQSGLPQIQILDPTAAPVGSGGGQPVHAARILLFSRKVARAQVLLARPQELREHAAPDGRGVAPVRLRLPVTLLGTNDATPVLIGTVAPPPAGLVYDGSIAWDASGRVILYDPPYGPYCGPDPKDGKTYLACPRTG